MTKKMWTPYRRARFEQPDGALVSPPSPRVSYLHCDVDEDTSVFQSSQSVQDEHPYPDGHSAGAYQTSPPQNGSWNSTCSSDLLSNISSSETGFDIDLPALDSHINSFLNFSGAPDFALPPENIAMVSKDPTEDWEATFSHRPLPPNLGSRVIPNQASAIQPTDNTAWNDSLVLPSLSQFPLERGGYDFLSLLIQQQWLRLHRASDRPVRQC
jgi:hypothetical protein